MKTKPHGYYDMTPKVEEPRLDPPRCNAAGWVCLLFCGLMILATGVAVGHMLAGRVLAGFACAGTVFFCLGVGFWTGFNVKE